MAYELGREVTPENTPKLQKCVNAATLEIDHAVDWLTPPDLGTMAPEKLALLNRTNVLRGVEWWKANDAAFGVIGFDETGVLQAPRDGFARHARTLSPLKEAWGLA